MGSRTQELIKIGEDVCSIVKSKLPYSHSRGSWLNTPAGKLSPIQINERTRTGRTMRGARALCTEWADIYREDFILNPITNLLPFLDCNTGNCGEYSLFSWVLSIAVINVIAKVDMMYLYNPKNIDGTRCGKDYSGDHAFIVIGRRDGSKANEFWTWGDNAVVCDVLNGTVFPAKNLPDRLPAYYKKKFYEHGRLLDANLYTTKFDKDLHRIVLVDPKRKITNAFTFLELEDQISNLVKPKDNTYIKKSQENYCTTIIEQWNNDIWQLENPLKKLHEKLYEGKIITREANTVMNKANAYLNNHKVESKNPRFACTSRMAAYSTIERLHKQMSILMGAFSRASIMRLLGLELRDLRNYSAFKFLLAPQPNYTSPIRPNPQLEIAEELLAQGKESYNKAIEPPKQIILQHQTSSKPSCGGQNNYSRPMEPNYAEKMLKQAEFFYTKTQEGPVAYRPKCLKQVKRLLDNLKGLNVQKTDFKRRVLDLRTKLNYYR